MDNAPRVGFFVTCLMNLFRPNVGFASVKLLEDAGCIVEVPQTQTCCGQPGYNSGDFDSARALARQVIDAFEKYDYVIGPSGSCMATLRHDYPELLKDEPVWHTRALAMSAKSHELLSFLTDVLGVKHVDAKYNGIVTYHDSCSGLRSLGIKGQPRQLLADVKGLQLTEMRDTEVCCGFGGTFCVKYPEISGRMVDDKLACIRDTGADTLLGGDLGCLMNIAGRAARSGQTLRVFHTAEVLAGMADGAGIEGGKLMRMESGQFKQASVIALHDIQLRTALARSREGFIGGRQHAVDAVPEFEQLRENAKRIKDHVLENLDHYLMRFEEAVTAAGGHVHFARDAAEARAIVLDICRAANAKTITKGKSMVSEEIGLNTALIEAGMEVVETDLGEYIIQLADEPPSHIVGPALHKTREQVTELFAEHHQLPRKETVATLVGEAREMLRDKFFRADVGITGANFLIAETGSSVIVTNEGNGDLTQTLPKLHIVTSGIERVLPNLDDLAVFLRLLARSATGQDTETYTTLSTGPRRRGNNPDPDGPEAYHVVLVDNGRSKMLGGKFRDMLRCIRCGACLNHCPVYGAIGGHAYGWVYPGPMGSVLTPLMQGLDGAYDLPNACTLNGRCQSVCPVKIPLPEMLRELRHMQHRARISPPAQRYAISIWRWFAARPALYHLATSLAARVLSWQGGTRRRIARLPFAGGWTAMRDLPAPSEQTFMAQYQARHKKQRGVL